MKKILLFLFAVLTSAFAMADEVTWVAADGGYNNGGAVSTITVNSNITIVMDKGTNNNNGPKYYTSGSAVRAYGGNTIAVNATGVKITNVTFTFGSSDGTNTITANLGTFESPTWTGEADAVIFTIGGTTGNRRLASISVTYDAGANVALKPSLTEGNTFTTAPYDVTITNNESGATVYYTTDGNDPTTTSDSFTGASKTISISATTTVKAMAVIAGKDNSSIASATYTKLNVATSWAGLGELTSSPKDVAVDMTGWKVLAVTSNNAYVKDATGKAGCFYENNHGFKAGDVLSGVVSVKAQLYNNYPEITVITTTTAGLTVTAGEVPAPITITADEAGDYLCNLVKIENVTFSSETYVANTTTITSEDGSVYVYDTFKVLGEATFSTTDKYDVTGIMLQYVKNNEAQIQIAPRTIDDVAIKSSKTASTITLTGEKTEANTGEGFDVTVTTNSDGEISVESSTPAIASVELKSNAGNYYFTVTPKAAGTVTISVKTAATATYLAGLKTFTLTVKEVMGGLSTFVNGGFEEWITDTQALGWKSSTTASNATTEKSTDARTGSYSCKIVNKTSNVRLASKEFLLGAGWYTFKFYAKSATETPAAQARPGYAPWDAAQNKMGTYTYGKYTENLSSTEWTEIVYTFELKEETQINLVVMNPKSIVGGTTYGDLLVDDVEFRAATAEEIATNINTVETEGAVKVQKAVKNGRLVIEKAGKQYNAAGALLK